MTIREAGAFLEEIPPNTSYESLIKAFHNLLPYLISFGSVIAGED